MNRYDQLVVDVPDLYARYPLADRASWGASPFRYRWAVGPQRLKRGLYTVLHRSRLEETWCRRFAQYWTRMLGGRPLLGPDDFHILRGIYRVRAQGTEIADDADPAAHVAAWQVPELLWFLFQQVYIETLRPATAALDALHRYAPAGDCLDVGAACGSLTAADQFCFPGAHRWTLADLPTVAFHYAIWRYGNDSTVSPILLNAADNFALPPGAFDAVTCLTVFEHLIDPLGMAQQIAARLKPGGVLVCDFLETTGEGLDTLAALRQRPAVLAYLRERFTLESGEWNARGGLWTLRLR